MSKLLTLLAMLWLTQPDAPAALRAELDALLTPAGRVESDDAERLDALAVRCARTAEAAADPHERLGARLLQARAYNAAAQHAIGTGRASLASMRLVQLRSAARAARRIDAPGAALAGDWWLLMADLIDINRNARTLAERQIGAIAQLERFLSLYAGDDAAQQMPMVRQVKFALMRLTDQAGDNERAMELMQQLHGSEPADAAHTSAFASVAAHAQLVGQPLDASLRPEDVSGRWLLLIVTGEDASVEPLSIEGDLVVRRVTVTAAEASTVAQGLGHALPHVVLVDSEGVIRAAGHTMAVAARFAAITQTPASQPNQ